MLKEIGAKVYNEGSTEKGLDAVREFLEDLEIDIGGLQLFDGSGLSRSNMITANMMTDMLSKITKHKFFTTFYNSLSVTGDPSDIGFFKSWGRGTSLQNNARVKSGLIDRVRSHSGSY